MLNKETIKSITKEFLKELGFDAEVEVALDDQEGLATIDLRAGEPQIWIGQGGKTLATIKHLLVQILSKKTGERIFLDLDINYYRKKKAEFTRQLAKDIADQVSLSKKPVMLDPMDSYIRRVVHIELAGRSDVVTESIGQGFERCVQIKPYP